MKLTNKFWDIEFDPDSPAVTLTLHSTKARLIVTKNEISQLSQILRQILRLFRLAERGRL